MDNYRHKGLRSKLVSALIEKGISDKSVLGAINSVPRHLFLDKAFEEQAYKDKALPIANGQTISQPYTVAFQTQLLSPQPQEIILEIGTGSGYQAAVLSHLCKKIYTIERHETLYKSTSTLLPRLGYRSVRTLFGDGYLGSVRFAPFDKILVTAGAENIPQALLDQLKVGGILVIPKGNAESKTMLEVIKTGPENYEIKKHGQFKFVPFLSGTVTI